MWTPYQFFLSVLLVTTGSLNTLSTKWSDDIEAPGVNGTVHHFNHPFFQSWTMFIGEFLCFLAFKFCFLLYARKGKEDRKELTKGSRKFNPFFLLPPALCDLVATSVMNIGLTMTFASSFQMFRGAVIVFVGILSMIFLKRRLKIVEWIGIVGVIAGLAVVGVSDFLNTDESSGYTTTDIVTGDLLIVLAQIVTASQMVVEEKFVAGLDIPPLQAVGWEGIFGFVVLTFLQIILYFVPAPNNFAENPNGNMEDAIDAFLQLWNEPILFVPVFGSIISIAFFNFAGISITKQISATTRMVLDSVRTVVIWVVSLLVFGQKFHWMQLLGFILLFIGMALYNGIFNTPIKKVKKKIKKTEKKKSVSSSTSSARSIAEEKH